MFGLTTCFFCSSIIKQKDAYRIIINSTQGQITKYVCDSCGSNLDDLVDQAETVEKVDWENDID